MIGIGIGWLVFGTTRRSRGAPTSPAADDLGSPAHAGSGSDGSNGTCMVGRAGRYAAEVGERARGLADTAQQRAGAAVQDNPLLLGALGLVLGAVIGAILPMGRRESEWLGEAQHQVMDQAEELGREALERAREVAEHAGRAAVEVVERELGLEPNTTTKPH